MSVTGSTRARGGPSGAEELATSDSPPISTLARLTLEPSDNFFAEMIIKGLGAAFGGAGSTAVGAKVVRSTVGDFGIAPRVVDGSGLSRSDQTSPAEMVKLLAALPAGSPVYNALFNGLPVAGRNGTLYNRMRGTAAQGRCHAKTGTLSNVSGLAGYCQAQGGELVAFAFLMNRVSVSGARELQDRMTAAIARYDADLSSTGGGDPSGGREAARPRRRAVRRAPAAGSAARRPRGAAPPRSAGMTRPS